MQVALRLSTHKKFSTYFIHNKDTSLFSKNYHSLTNIIENFGLITMLIYVPCINPQATYKVTQHKIRIYIQQLKTVQQYLSQDY